MAASEQVSAEEQAWEELELAPDTVAPRLARAALEPLVPDFASGAGFRARLAITELVTNCVRHAPRELARRLPSGSPPRRARSGSSFAARA